MNTYRASLIRAVASIRPAPVAAFALSALRVQRIEFPSAGGVFWVDPGSQFGRELMETGQYDQVVTAILDQYLHPGSTFVDLGANEGYFTVLASKLVGSVGRVIAVEPQTRLQPVLRKNLALNGCNNVEIMQCVVTDSTGTACLQIAPRTNTGASSLFTAAGHTEQVRSITLQSLLAEAGIEKCALMKIDVEGAEYDIIVSSAELLRSKAIKALSVDLHDSLLARRKLSVGPIHFTLAKCGYELVRGSHPALYVRDETQES